MIIQPIQKFYIDYLISTTDVVATTYWNGTCSLLTSAKLTEGYLVMGITRELDKEPSLHCSSIYINTMWSMLQQYLPVLISMLLPHILLLIYHASTLRLPCHVHVPWHHTLFNLYHHACTMCTPWGTHVPWHHF